jgi:hypothetical protein
MLLRKVFRITTERPSIPIEVGRKAFVKWFSNLVELDKMGSSRVIDTH